MTLILEKRKLPQLCAHLWQWNTLVPSFSSGQSVNSKQEHLVPQNKPPPPGHPCSHARFSSLCSVSSGPVYEEQAMKVTDRRVSAAFHLLPLFSTSLPRLFPRSPSIGARSLRPSVSRGCWLSSVSQSSDTTSQINYCWPHSVHTSKLTHTHPLLRWLRRYIQTSYTPGNGAEWDGAPCCSLWSSEWWLRPKTAKTTSPANNFQLQ